MLSRELDEAIFTLRDSLCLGIVIDSVLAAKLSDLLLVAAATGQPIQAVAETVARSVIHSHKQEQGQIELRNA
jgi:hypothetical protein